MLSLSNPALYPMLALVAVLALAMTTQGFLTGQNIKSALDVVAITGIAAVGLTAVTVSGNLFVLSTAAVATAVAIAYAMLLNAGLNVVLCIALALLIALALGLLQGGIVAAGLNPIVTTLAVGGALTGLAPIVTNNQIFELNGGASVWLGQAKLLGVSLPIVEFALVTLVAGLLMGRTRGGRRMYLVGANKHTARATGLRPATATLAAFAAASVAVGLAGIAGSAQVGLVAPTAFDPLTFDTITAVIVGGAAIQGGSGSPLATAIASIFVGLVTNVVELHGYSYGVQLAVEGVLVCAAVIGYSILARAPE
jgi:ribose/xylose/arabinose/galactoside ABC-type transport system permease subunit